MLVKPKLHLFVGAELKHEGIAFKYVSSNELKLFYYSQKQSTPKKEWSISSVGKV